MQVMKFGGASVATADHFHRIAEIIARQADEEIVVVISAMGRMTDDLLSLAKQVHPNPPNRESDMLVSVGERISISLLAMALDLQGRKAVSFTGSQSGIITSSNHAAAKIIDVRPRRVLEALKQKKVAIVAGFQGVSQEGEITTLGRGGSDTSAVALAVALGADVDFYKDVQGIYTADPKKNPEATLIPEMSYDEALSLAERGDRILHARSIVLAKQNGVRLFVRPFALDREVGTIIGKEISRNPTIEYEKED